MRTCCFCEEPGEKDCRLTFVTVRYEGGARVSVFQRLGAKLCPSHHDEVSRRWRQRRGFGVAFLVSILAALAGCIVVLEALELRGPSGGVLFAVTLFGIVGLTALFASKAKEMKRDLFDRIASRWDVDSLFEAVALQNDAGVSFDIELTRSPPSESELEAVCAPLRVRRTFGR